jgi:hypothetical protein
MGIRCTLRASLGRSITPLATAMRRMIGVAMRLTRKATTSTPMYPSKIVRRLSACAAAVSSTGLAAGEVDSWVSALSTSPFC